MSTATTFGHEAGTVLDYTFDQDFGEPQIAAAVDDLVAWCDTAGVDLRANRCGRDLSMQLNSHADLMVVRELLAKWDQTTLFRHKQNFSPPDDDHQRTWVAAACGLLDNAGIKYTIEQQPGVVGIEFKSYDAMLMFNELVYSGFVDRKTEATLRTDGPAPA